MNNSLWGLPKTQNLNSRKILGTEKFLLHTLRGFYVFFQVFVIASYHMRRVATPLYKRHYWRVTYDPKCIYKKKRGKLLMPGINNTDESGLFRKLIIWTSLDAIQVEKRKMLGLTFECLNISRSGPKCHHHHRKAKPFVLYFSFVEIVHSDLIKFIGWN